jgi:hypothetical protein
MSERYSVRARVERGAWALSLVGAATAVVASRAASLARPAAGLAAVTLATIAAVHVAWAFGWRWGLAVAIPSVDGAPAFAPPRGLTLAVAFALAVASVLAWSASRASAAWIAWLSLGAAAVFALRAIGDLRYAGIFKREGGTPFAWWDDRLFTPLCVALSMCFALVSAGARP